MTTKCRKAFVIAQAVATAAIIASTAFKAAPGDPEFTPGELDALAGLLRFMASRNQLENLQAIVNRALKG